MTTSAEVTRVTSSPDETVEFARQLVADLPGRIILALDGELGAGKTCFVRGVALALGIETTITSPTFTLINEYSGTRPLYHVDLYRVGNIEDLTTIGIEELLETSGVLAIEWAERGQSILPPDTIHVKMTTLDNPQHRQIRVTNPGN
jgi:tRNA threonylcarbamoyladenosine biosynthesis protein TsaE